MNKNPRLDEKLSLTTPSSTNYLQIQALDDILEAILQSGLRKNAIPGHQYQQSAAVDQRQIDMKEDIMRQILSLIEPPTASADQSQEVADSQIAKDLHDPYLDGINIVEGMSILGKKKDQLDAHVNEDMFDLTRIRAFEEKLRQIVDDEDPIGTETNRDRVMTFLTEQYPPNPVERGQDPFDDDFEEGRQGNSQKKRYQVMAKQRILVEQAKKISA